MSAGADTCCKGEHWATYLREVIAMLTETYSASTLAISGLIFWFDRSHDLILFSLLSRSALKIAHQPFVPSELSHKLQSRVRSARQGVLTVMTKSIAAYLTLVSVLLTLSASASFSMPDESGWKSPISA